MTESEIVDPSLVKFATNRRRPEDPYVSELLKGLVSSFRDLEEKNLEFEQRNAELLSALQEANARIVELEEAERASPEASRAAFKMAAEILVSGEETVSSILLSAKAETDNRHEEASRSVIEAQNEILALLRKTREENVRLNQEASEKAIDVLRESRNSILAMAESLGQGRRDRAPAPTTDQTSRVAPVTSYPEVSLAAHPQAAPSPGAVRDEAGSGRPAKEAPERNGHATLAFKVAEVLQTIDGANSRSHTHEEQETLSYLPRALAAIQCTDDEADWSPAQTPTNGNQPRAAEMGAAPQVPAPIARSVQLVAAGLDSFRDLMSFQRSVQKLPGVLAVHAESFHSGSIRLRVRHQNAMQLDKVLSEMSGFRLRLMSSTPDQIAVAVAV